MARISYIDCAIGWAQTEGFEPSLAAIGCVMNILLEFDNLTFLIASFVLLPPRPASVHRLSSLFFLPSSSSFFFRPSSFFLRPSSFSSFFVLLRPSSFVLLPRRKKDEGKRKKGKEEGRIKKDEGRRTKEEGRRTKEEG